MDITSKTNNGTQAVIQTVSNAKAAERYAAYVQKFQSMTSKGGNKTC